MNFIVENWMLIAVAVSAGAMLMWPLVKGATGGALSPAGAVQLINRERAIVIDAGLVLVRRNAEVVNAVPLLQPTHLHVGHFAASLPGQD